jgi:hypothetical protein
LNRALRPLLAMLRGDGVDAFYPGRDLITAGGAAIAHASFTVARDGVAFVEMHVAETPSFDRLETLLDRFDSNGVAGVDRHALDASTSLVEQKCESRSDDDWAQRLATFAASTWSCDARVGGHPPSADAACGDAAHGDAAHGDRPITTAHETAARDFLLEPGLMEEGARSAAMVSMLGVIECSGRLRGDRLVGLRICGDFIAPFHTVDDIAFECEGEPLRPANIRKALARAMARPRSFLLGLRELDELILRLV